MERLLAFSLVLSVFGLSLGCLAVCAEHAEKSSCASDKTNVTSIEPAYEFSSYVFNLRSFVRAYPYTSSNHHYCRLAPAFAHFGVSWLPLAGLNLRFTEKLSSLIIYDGVRTHPILNYTHGRHNFSFVLAFANRPGFSYSVSF